MFVKIRMSENGRESFEVIQANGNIAISYHHGILVKHGDGVYFFYAEGDHLCKPKATYPFTRMTRSMSAKDDELFDEKRVLKTISSDGFDFLSIVVNGNVQYAQVGTVFILSDSGKTIDRY